MKKKNRETEEVNLLELIPEKLVDDEIDDDGIITLLVPRYNNRLLKKLNKRTPSKRFVKIRLDEIGSGTWSSIDGKKDVRKIGETMREKFGNAIEPCYDRLGIFMTKLEYEKYIRYKNLDQIRTASDS
ncbi:MAG: PqqD family protein [Candidatus Krumholzibacteriota bacterium]|nr:PqqD family protein [Candidatus Krumholzibacteriota bacterium]